jgi:hypothetical protein
LIQSDLPHRLEQSLTRVRVVNHQFQLSASFFLSCNRQSDEKGRKSDQKMIVTGSTKRTLGRLRGRQTSGSVAVAEVTFVVRSSVKDGGEQNWIVNFDLKLVRRDCFAFFCRTANRSNYDDQSITSFLLRFPTTLLRSIPNRACLLFRTVKFKMIVYRQKKKQMQMVRSTFGAEFLFCSTLSTLTSDEQKSN